MPDPKELPPSPLWDYTLSIYGREGVSAACIALQDRHDLDVNFLLLCVFTGTRGCALSDDAFGRLELGVGPWRQHVIHPLRNVRRWLKEQELLPPELVDGLRRGVLGREINSEGLQQRLMERTLAIPQGTADAGIAAGNLMRYLAWSGISPDDQDLASLATILAQAFPPATPEAARAMLARGP